ncbi:MAG: polyprenyl synthetase family protein [Dehalococcoidales bacterium]|nr:polyprenyl synthetase family protein [Dehalococcoidales bacterium]
MQLNEIYAPIQKDLLVVEDKLKSLGVVDSPWLNDLLCHALKGGGKRLRPALAILSSSFYDYNLERLMPMVLSVELMHLATLVHDDTIDNSFVRWSRPTVNKIWGIEKAVLLGDYLFARAGALTASTENIRVIKLLPQTLTTITNGELAQAASAFKLEQSREHYFFRISCKTAALFVFATESGAVLSKAPEEAIKILHDYGYNLGIAFQIIDDILDFIGTEEEVGKPVGSDLAQGTVTLPSLILMERYPQDNPVKKLFQGGDKKESIEQAIEMVRNSDIIQECFHIASEYRTRACQDLAKLPHKDTLGILTNLADFIVTRKR